MRCCFCADWCRGDVLATGLLPQQRPQLSAAASTFPSLTNTQNKTIYTLEEMIDIQIVTLQTPVACSLHRGQYELLYFPVQISSWFMKCPRCTSEWNSIDYSTHTKWLLHQRGLLNTVSTSKCLLGKHGVQLIWPFCKSFFYVVNNDRRQIMNRIRGSRAKQGKQYDGQEQFQLAQHLCSSLSGPLLNFLEL